jgi:hypothetical protein
LFCDKHGLVPCGLRPRLGRIGILQQFLVFSGRDLIS